MFTVEQRAFMAGLAYGETGGTIDPNKLIEAVDGMIQLARLNKNDLMIQTAWQSIQLKMSDYFATEEASRNAKLAESGVDLSKKMSEWDGAEWKQAVTVVAMYRYWLQREISCCNDIATSDLVRKSVELSAVSDHAAELARNHFAEREIPMVDPQWSAKLIRRMVCEAQAVTDAG